jgi:hypothetical protein
MFLHSVTLADITTINGLEITLSAWEGRRDPTIGTAFKWPRVQTGLPTEYWNTWRRALRICFLPTGSSRQLVTRLGKWYSPPFTLETRFILFGVSIVLSGTGKDFP